ncbi:hypothetical protein ACWFRN_14945, partial [Streptomyces celluloflavus]
MGLFSWRRGERRRSAEAGTDAAQAGTDAAGTSDAAASGVPAESAGSAPGAASAHPGGGRSAAEPGWTALPPVQRVLAAPRTVAAPDFARSLSAHHNPSFYGELSHEVRANAPAGVLGGVLTPLTGQPSALDLPALRLPVAGQREDDTATPAPRTVADAGTGAGVGMRMGLRTGVPAAPAAPTASTTPTGPAVSSPSSSSSSSSAGSAPGPRQPAPVQRRAAVRSPLISARPVPQPPRQLRPAGSAPALRPERSSGPDGPPTPAAPVPRAAAA